MSRKFSRTLAAVALSVGVAAIPMADVEASYRDRNGGGSRGGPDRAVSYINPDQGLATFNPDVDPRSSCNRPDQQDTQKVSPAGSTANNVHNDACLFGGSSSGSRDGGSYGGGWNDGGWNGGSGGSYGYFDGPASFEISGVGTFNACPDPDNAGPKTAAGQDTQRCYQSGYQMKDMAGDREFHARINSQIAGTSRVTFCYDPENNGCADARVKSQISINWVN